MYNSGHNQGKITLVFELSLQKVRNEKDWLVMRFKDYNSIFTSFKSIVREIQFMPSGFSFLLWSKFDLQDECGADLSRTLQVIHVGVLAWEWPPLLQWPPFLQVSHVG